MRSLIVVISVVFIAVIVTSYLYFSNLGKGKPSKQEGIEIAASDMAVPPEASGYPAPFWAFDLNAEPVNKPIVCVLDDTHRFILIQDSYHILYAISASGEKLWNAQLPGTILGNIHQLSDSSLLFTTAERLYRIDKEGDPLPGFSLQLPQKATDDGATASYENSGNVRIDVQSSNRVLSFDGRGRRLQNRNSHIEAVGNTPDENREVQSDLRNSLPTGCGPLFYFGPLSGDEVNYLLCGNDQKLVCYRYD